MEKKKIFVLPGEIAVSRQPAVIATLLGSCVAVCLYNINGKFGGMNHFMLPTGERPEMRGKYGDWATDKLVETLLRLDPQINNYEAYLYGGGAVVGHLSVGVGIGDKNIDMAISRMAHHGIPVKGQELGGTNGRKIFFDTSTGKVEMRMIEKSEQTQALENKKKTLDKRKIRVLVVDDSATIRQIITKALVLDPGIEVVGEAENPYVAREKLLELDPDVITLDIIMPKMDGVTFLKKLMMFQPKPVIIVSSVAQKGSKHRMRANSIGAVDVLDKEDLKLYQGLETASAILTQKVRLAAMSHVKKKTADEIGHI
ncbi:MAG: response regulator [Nitrospinota bacterium]